MSEKHRRIFLRISIVTKDVYEIMNFKTYRYVDSIFVDNTMKI